MSIHPSTNPPTHPPEIHPSIHPSIHLVSKYYGAETSLYRNVSGYLEGLVLNRLDAEMSGAETASYQNDLVPSSGHESLPFSRFGHITWW